MELGLFWDLSKGQAKALLKEGMSLVRGLKWWTATLGRKKKVLKRGVVIGKGQNQWSLVSLYLQLTGLKRGEVCGEV